MIRLNLDVAPGSRWISGAPWMKLPLDEAIKNEDIKPIADLKISNEEEKEYQEGVIFEKIPELLTRGHAINKQRVSEIEKRVIFSSYLVPPVNTNLKNYLKTVVMCFRFITKIRSKMIARKNPESDELFAGPFLNNPINFTPVFFGDQDQQIVLSMSQTTDNPFMYFPGGK